MNLKELENKRKGIEKKIFEIEAQRGVNQQELEKITKSILEKTGLKSLDSLEDYMSRLEEELSTNQNKLSEELSVLEVQLVDALGEGTDNIKEDLDEI